MLETKGYKPSPYNLGPSAEIPPLPKPFNINNKNHNNNINNKNENINNNIDNNIDNNINNNNIENNDNNCDNNNNDSNVCSLKQLAAMKILQTRDYSSANIPFEVKVK